MVMMEGGLMIFVTYIHILLLSAAKMHSHTHSNVVRLGILVVPGGVVAQWMERERERDKDQERTA